MNPPLVLRFRVPLAGFVGIPAVSGSPLGSVSLASTPGAGTVSVVFMAVV